jgi:hypothetical protein
MKKISTFVLTLGLILLAGSAWADQVTLDFTSLFGGNTAGDKGATLSFTGLTITAKTGVAAASNPFVGGTAGKVYWGDLGMLGGSATSLPPAPSSGYFGLGVLSNADLVADSTTGPITFHEALVFNFALPQDPKNQVYFGNTQSSTDLSFTLLGANYVSAGTNTNPADNVRVFLKVASGEVVYTDINAGAFTVYGVQTDGAAWNSVIRYILNTVSYADEHIVGLAVEEVWGSTTNLTRQFGFGSITYDNGAVVPLPGAVLLLGAGLMRLGVYMKRKDAA